MPQRKEANVYTIASGLLGFLVEPLLSRDVKTKKHNKSIWLPLSPPLQQILAPSVAHNATRRRIKQKLGQESNLESPGEESDERVRVGVEQGRPDLRLDQASACVVRCLCIGEATIT
ncbi:hypothetical protein RRG08_011128 [Elysia crispata]|uniref:Uncharacterized protein n=1 Tax=Elysia crispata TaxID=231223 RepID=A0AAE1A195_9GAST|nr:hypothetical protein RRG08_011128 [Elysia crispata]